MHALSADEQVDKKMARARSCAQDELWCSFEGGEQEEEAGFAAECAAQAVYRYLLCLHVW